MGLGAAGIVPRHLLLCQVTRLRQPRASSNIPQVLLLKVQRDPRGLCSVWASTPRPGYLSVRLLHCRGHGPATGKGGGQPVSVAALAGLLCLEGGGGNEKGSQGPVERPGRAGEGHGRRMVSGRHDALLTTPRSLYLELLWALTAWEREGWPYMAPAGHRTSEFPTHGPLPKYPCWRSRKMIQHQTH